MKNSYKLLILAASAAFAVSTAYAGDKCKGGCSGKKKDVSEETSSLVDATVISVSNLK